MAAFGCFLQSKNHLNALIRQLFRSFLDLYLLRLTKIATAYTFFLKGGLVETIKMQF